MNKSSHLEENVMSTEFGVSVDSLIENLHHGREIKNNLLTVFFSEFLEYLL